MGLEETDPEFIAHVGENDGPENDDPEADEVEDEAKGTSHADDMKSPPKERKKKRPTFAFVNDSSYQRRRVYGSTNVNKRNEKSTS